MLPVIIVGKAEVERKRETSAKPAVKERPNIIRFEVGGGGDGGERGVRVIGVVDVWGRAVEKSVVEWDILGELLDEVSGREGLKGFFD